MDDKALILNAVERPIVRSEPSALIHKALGPEREGMLAFTDRVIAERAERVVFLTTHLSIAVSFILLMRDAIQEGLFRTWRVGIISDGELEPFEAFSNGLEFLAGMRSLLGSALSHAMLVSASDDLARAAEEIRIATFVKGVEPLAPSEWYKAFLEGRPW